MGIADAPADIEGMKVVMSTVFAFFAWLIILIPQVVSYQSIA